MICNLEIGKGGVGIICPQVSSIERGAICSEEYDFYFHCTHMKLS